MNPFTPRTLSLSAIELLGARSTRDGEFVVRTGAPASMYAPTGMAHILRLGGQGNLGVSGGLTLIKSAAAFTPPSFVTTHTHRRVGPRVEHYAVVQRTTSGEASHESYCPAAGEHLRPGMTQQIGGRTYTHYWLVSQKIAELIRQGEQEHLDDAARAYELTYKKIEVEINAIAGKEFGPANTPAEADRLAEAAFARAMPAELGTSPANWVKALDTLLARTQVRDRSGWHALSTDPPRTVGSKILHPVATTSTTRIGQFAASQVVNF